MSQELIQLNSQRLITRIVLIVAIVLMVVWCYVVFCWYIGNTLAEYFNTAEHNTDTAVMASALSPKDPLPHWRLGTVYQQRLTPDQASKDIAEYEKAVSLSPNDYRYWMSLGSALEQVGDAARGERALRKAVELAPAYAFPHWYLGNLLLRSGRYDEAFGELRAAAQADSELKYQLFNVAIAVYGNDSNGLRSAAGDEPSMKAQLADYLLHQQRVQEGLAIWDTLNQDQKKAEEVTAGSMINSLIATNRFHDAMNIWNSIAPTDSSKVELGRVLDGGFEETISHSKDKAFGWQVSSATQMQVGIDPEIGHTGTRSLRLVFQVRARLDALDASELVPVAPATQYEFECYVRTAKLQGADTPFVVIVDPSNKSVLANSTEVPNGDNDWTRISLSFKTGDKTQAVRIQLARTQCEKDKICPLFGAVWYDDFSLKRHD